MIESKIFILDDKQYNILSFAAKHVTDSDSGLPMYAVTIVHNDLKLCKMLHTDNFTAYVGYPDTGYTLFVKNVDLIDVPITVYETDAFTGDQFATPMVTGNYVHRLNCYDIK